MGGTPIFAIIRYKIKLCANASVSSRVKGVVCGRRGVVIKSIVSIDYGFSAVLRAGVRISTGWGLFMSSSPPIIAQSSVVGIKGSSFIPIKCVAGCQSEWGVVNANTLFPTLPRLHGSFW